MVRRGASRVFAFIALSATSAIAQTPRLLGVYSVASGEPIEGVEVFDMTSKTSALTTKTGTVSLSFLPNGTSLLRVRKVGYEAFTTVVTISPVDTLPVTVMLKPAVPVSYAVIVTVGGSLTCAVASVAITKPAKATDAANRMI